MAVETNSANYLQRRAQIEHYFDRTAADVWATLTSTEPLGRIRATVRAGRDQMRQNLLDWLPQDLAGARVLDAGCGTGASSVELAQRGAHVTAVDLSAALLEVARRRMPVLTGSGSIRFENCDMLSPLLGQFDYVVAMDSLIHYQIEDVTRVLEGLAANTQAGIAFTIAPWTPLLAAMHLAGRVLPGPDRAPDIVPVRTERFVRDLQTLLKSDNWQIADTRRVSTGFYKSEGIYLSR
jgi:magnesium-protoporphyrin O-methyltransferase